MSTVKNLIEDYGYQVSCENNGLLGEITCISCNAIKCFYTSKSSVNSSLSTFKHNQCCGNPNNALSLENAMIERFIPPLSPKIATLRSAHNVANVIEDVAQGTNKTPAEACFLLCGIDKDAKCPHGLKFYACMPCSH